MADCVDLWVTFAQMYGAKALETKFGATPPDEWRHDIDKLREYELDRGIARLKSKGEAHIPSLPQFLRLCREVHSEIDPGGNDAQQPADDRVFARWVVTANRHLLAYLVTRTDIQNRVTSDARFIQPLVDAKNMWAEQMREWERDEELPPDHGRGLWNDMMRGAETSVDYLARQS